MHLAQRRRRISGRGATGKTAVLGVLKRGGEVRALDEQAYRFNERGGKDFGRFRRALTRIVGRRLTYDELTGKMLAPGAPV